MSNHPIIVEISEQSSGPTERKTLPLNIIHFRTFMVKQTYVKYNINSRVLTSFLGNRVDLSASEEILR